MGTSTNTYYDIIFLKYPELMEQRREQPKIKAYLEEKAKGSAGFARYAESEGGFDKLKASLKKQEEASKRLTEANADLARRLEEISERLGKAEGAKTTLEHDLRHVKDELRAANTEIKRLEDENTRVSNQLKEEQRRLRFWRKN